MTRQIKTTVLSLFTLLLLLPGHAAGQDSADLSWPGEQQAWVVKDYRYVPGSAEDDANTGLSLCSTRCNAMTLDYRTVIDPGGYRLIRIAENRELKVDLNNPYIGGYCICVADEYQVRLDEFNRPRKQLKD